jgi:fimbrial chaperone protein
MMNGARLLCTTLIALAAAHNATAGAFSVSPTRVEFKGDHRTAVMTLRNADDAPLTVQASLVSWTQPDGEDVYTDTRELLVTPPVFTIAPKGEQIVRLALRREVDATREMPYRIFFQEIPQAQNPTFNGLNIALRVGVPIFVIPKAPAESTLHWEIARTADGKLQIAATNTGNAHVQVTDFKLSFAATDVEKTSINVVKYVLPGSRMIWLTPMPGNATDTSPAHIHGASDHGEFDADIELARH